MRTVALYLPQFHRIKENDDWWGEGYTEWTAVKRARPQYKNHIQPRIPLNNYYYDLMEKKTMEWQSRIAKEYKIDGFSFYHYYFTGDIKLLEKPAENLLKWKDININFFFTWDPGTWARSWSRIGNSWADTFESEIDNKKILIEQKSGTKQDWEKHLQYLLKFFKDDRYIKIHGKPVFNIISLYYVPCIDEMISYWRHRIVEEGFDGLYLITSGDYYEGADAYINPMRPEKNNVVFRPKGQISVYDYDESWLHYLSCQKLPGIDNIWQCMVDYDDTPRKGEKSMIFQGASPQKFQDYYACLRFKSLNNDNQFLIINAWNEWGEGMYLEPDTENGYKFLEAIRFINSLTLKDLENYVKNLNFNNKINMYDQSNIDKSCLDGLKVSSKYNFVKLWLNLKLNDNAIGKYLLNHGYNEVAIYGFGVRGKMVYKELLQDGISVPYVIDRNAEQMQEPGIKVINPDEDFPKCDLVVISVERGYSDIYKSLLKKLKCSILSINELCVYANEEIMCNLNSI